MNIYIYILYIYRRNHHQLFNIFRFYKYYLLSVTVAKRLRFQKFAQHTLRKRSLAALTGGAPSKFPKWKNIPAWKAPDVVESFAWMHRIAVDDGIPATDLPDIDSSRITVLRGPRRMHKCNAQLMVFRSMAQLHTCGPLDRQHLCDLIYIIGLGVPVVVASTWRMTGGNPAKLADRASGIVIHLPALEDQFTFMLERNFANSEEGSELVVALGHCAKQPNSKWRVYVDSGRPLAAKGAKVSSIAQLAAVVMKLRKLHRGGCRGYMANLQ